MSTEPTAPSAACAAFAPLLPLVSHGLVDAAAQPALARHLAACAHCRADLALHDRTDAALRRALAPRSAAAAPWTRAEILSMLSADRGTGSQDGDEVRGAQTGTFGSPRPRGGGQSGAEMGRAPRTAGAAGQRYEAKPRGYGAVAAAVLLVALLAGTLFALARGRNTPAGQPAPLPAGLAIQAAAMVSPTEGWAVGSVTAVAGFPRPIALHYTAGGWRVVTIALPGALGRQSAVLTGIAMVSASEGWAVGHTVLGHAPGVEVDGVTTGILLRDVGGTWRYANGAGAPWDALRRAGGYQLLSVIVDRGDTVWIVGTDAAGGALVLRGGAAGGPMGWERVSDPALVGVAPMAAAADPTGGLWIAGVEYGAGPGFDGTAPGVILRFDGRAWRRQPLPEPRLRVAGFAPTAGGTVWAVGTLPGAATAGGGAAAHPGTAVVLRSGGGAWTVAARFAGPSGAPAFGFTGVAIGADGTGWAVGTGGAVARLVGGRWEIAASPTHQDLLCVAVVSPSAGWAFGAGGFILRETGGAWQRYGQ